MLQYTKVKFVQDRITDADLKAKKLFSQDKEYEFDYLIAGFGSEPAFFDIPGIEENAFTLWSLEDAEKLHDHILNMFRKASEEKRSGQEEGNAYPGSRRRRVYRRGTGR